MPNTEWLRKNSQMFGAWPMAEPNQFSGWGYPVLRRLPFQLCLGRCLYRPFGCSCSWGTGFPHKEKCDTLHLRFFSWENVLLWYFGDQHMYMYIYIYCSMYDIGLSTSIIVWCLWLKGRGKTWFHKGYQTFWVYVAEAQRRVWWQVTLCPISNMQFDPMFFICFCETSKYTFIAMLLVRQWYSNVEMSFCTSLNFVASISTNL